MSGAITTEEFHRQFGSKKSGGNATRPAKGRVKDAKKGMNKLEERYAQHLDSLRAQGVVSWWGFEYIVLKLADDTRITIDFAVQLPDGEIVLRDTKAMNRKTGKSIIEDDAAVKLRVAATHSPFRIETVSFDGMCWVHKEICPQ